MELKWNVKKVRNTSSGMGESREVTETTEVTYIIPETLGDDSQLRMRSEFVEMISAMFGPKTVVESYAGE